MVIQELLAGVACGQGGEASALLHLHMPLMWAGAKDRGACPPAVHAKVMAALDPIGRLGAATTAFSRATALGLGAARSRTACREAHDTALTTCGDHLRWSVCLKKHHQGDCSCCARRYWSSSCFFYNRPLCERLLWPVLPLDKPICRAALHGRCTVVPTLSAHTLRTNPPPFRGCV